VIFRFMRSTPPWAHLTAVRANPTPRGPAPVRDK
jgi:hypothetical protein